MADKVRKTEQEWRRELAPEQYHVTREKGTERPFTGKYCDNHEQGAYRCVGCGQELFESDAKYDSGSGWPSFVRPSTESHVTESQDESHATRRVEVLCSRCDSHLGHVFPDGPEETTGLRYCINSAALKLHPADP
jgi:peptide-methionine (R)-S-oxide reductase